MDRSFIFYVYAIFEKLKQKVPFKVLEGSTSNDYKSNFFGIDFRQVD